MPSVLPRRSQSSGRRAPKLAFRCVLFMLFSAWTHVAFAQPVVKRVLFITHSAGFVHDVLPLARSVMVELGQTTGEFTVTATDDVSLLNEATLATYDAVMFFTSGTLPINDAQKLALLSFVRSGGGFVGVHSATDTFYDWPEYGDLIGGYFDGHPWVQPVTIVNEDPAHPSMQHLGPSFGITEEIYQFRAWSRQNVHVLMHLDTSSVDLAVPGVSAARLADRDFALAWTRPYGTGRVFYTALGHFAATWNDPRFRTHILQGLRWAMSDADGDRLPDEWEAHFGLNPQSAAGADGASGDPDGDGRTNAQERADGTHPRSLSTRYFAEGATSTFFDTRISIANPTMAVAHTLLRFQRADGTTVPWLLDVPARQRRDVVPGSLFGLTTAEFSTVVESDAGVIADRVMSWDRTSGYGTHAEHGLTAPSLDWYFAEGATHSGFNLFVLLQNPGASTSQVEIRYLRPSGPPLSRSYAVTPGSRLTIWVNQIPELSATDVSAAVHVTGGPPILAERAMYLTNGPQLFAAGHDSAGVTSAAIDWFLAEGATGAYFDTFVLIANPGATDARIDVSYLLPGGATLVKQYVVPAATRFNIWLDEERFGGQALLADTAVSTTLHVTNGVPVVVERAMWWPFSPASWHEAHGSPGATAAGPRWGFAAGEVSGPPANAETYLLVANTGTAPATVRVTLLFDDGGPEAARQIVVAARSRYNVPVRDVFPEAIGRRFGALVESTGSSPAPLVVERAIYSDAAGVHWAAGSDALGERLP